MRSIIKFALRNQKLHRYLRRIYDENAGSIKAATTVETAVPEASAIQMRPSTFKGKRLNLLVPALSVQHVFGGIATALNFLNEATRHLGDVRIILTDQVAFSYEDNPAFSDWKIRELDDDDEGGRLIVAAGNRYAKTLNVAASDYFIATAWWTAVSAQALQSQQQQAFQLASPNKYIYLIQDYEPGFYPWSSRYALAESTYHGSDNFTAVFNTSILKDFFLSEGYRFHSYFHFEPVLHHKLRPFLTRVQDSPREKKILVYGRPTVERNAFSIIVMALQEWVRATHAEGWTFVSAGETHMPIDLGNNNQLVSLGKLSIEDYAHELLTSYAGISLMISPHPSYPPLEMAIFGVQVITNDYKSKHLAALSPNIHTVAWASPLEVARKLEELTAVFSTNQPMPEKEAAQDGGFLSRFRSESDPFTGIMENILAETGIGSATR